MYTQTKTLRFELTHNIVTKKKIAITFQYLLKYIAFKVYLTKKLISN